MSNVLCIGEALIDMICTDKNVSLANGEHFLKRPGGAPTNVAAAIGALGGKVSIVAKVGNDPFGEQLIHVMQNFNVDTRFLLKDKNHFTTLAFVSLFNNGERDFVFNRGADGQLTEQEVNAIDLTQFSIVHFGSATAFLKGPLQNAYTALLLQAKQHNCFISFDPNYRHLLYAGDEANFITQSWNFINNAHFVKVSDEEAMLLTNTNTVEAATSIFLERYKNVFVITLGSKGALLGFNGSTFIIPSVHVNAVDTTGAGDAFVGATLFQIARFSKEEMDTLSLMQWHSIVAKANSVAAKTCEHFGAMEAFAQLNATAFTI
jgi:fructokinase